MNIIESIYIHPENWTNSIFTFTHKDGTEIWVANGVFFYNLYPEGAWGILQKIKFYKAYKWWCENKQVRDE